MVSQLAASKVKVALSGDGGDELFSAGICTCPKPCAPAWKKIRAMPEPMAHHSRSLIKKAHLFQGIISQIEEETPYFAPVLYPKAQYSRLFPGLNGRGCQPPPIPAAADADDIQRMMAAAGYISQG